MPNLIFTSIKKALSVLRPEVYSIGLEGSVNAGIFHEVQHLTIEEHSAVVGGPQVQNVPEEG